MKRVFLIVLDSCGVGAAPDAADFGDAGSNTLRSCAQSGHLYIPNLIAAGIGNMDGVDCLPSVPSPTGAIARLREASMGKDTTIGHWEIAGVVSPNPLPTYPQGFPKEVLDAFAAATGRGILCNLPYSGTEVIKDYGDEHIRTGKPIVYTSADSVFQIACHESIYPLEKLYAMCRSARSILTGENAVGRVIARPFAGESGNYYRTGGRHDYSLEPTGLTMLDKLKQNGFDVISVGKINDIFAGRGITESHPTKGNAEGEALLLDMQKRDFRGICFVNLVDFDMLYGHRNNIAGYAAAAEEFDTVLGKFIRGMSSSDLLMITADHGCDPGYPGTDHTRENIPVLAYSPDIAPKNAGVFGSYACIAKTICGNFGIENDYYGKGLL